MESRIDVWRIDNEYDRPLDHIRSLLAPDENNRANAFANEPHMRRYVLAHVARRIILAKYAHISLDRLDFGAIANGKPVLANDLSDGLQLDFSLSHTGGISLLAVSSTGRVGVDIERIVTTSRWRSWASEYFSCAEWDLVLSSDNADASFYHAWTKKEAIVKVHGVGLTDNLALVDTTDMAAAQKMGVKTVEAFNVGACYAAAVASDVGGGDTCVRDFDWSAFE